MKIFWRLVITALCWALLNHAVQAAAEKRVALVIGNSKYQRGGELTNPANDARAIAKALQETGFEVIKLENASLKKMQEAVREFGDTLRSNHGAVALFYYAGHGAQASNKNYLIPVDHNIVYDDEVSFNALDVDQVLAKMESANNKTNIVILDACRDAPFKKRSRSSASGLAAIQAPQGSYIAYATAPGQTASDGQGANGLYTSKLLEQIRQPGLKIEDVFKRVRVAVTRDSGGQQVPWDSSSLSGDFYFVPSRSGTVSAVNSAPEAAADNGNFELAFWNSIKNSQNPQDYQAYLQQYPQGRFVALAKSRAQVPVATRQSQVRGEENAAPTAAPSLNSKLDIIGNELTVVKVSDLRAAKRNDFLTVQAEMTNTDSSNRQIYYRFKWLDNAGFTVGEEEVWKPITLYGKQKQLVQALAPNPRVTDFRLVIQNP